MAPPPDKSIARYFGEFVGRVWQRVNADPAEDRTEVRRTVDESERTTPDGRSVILRRTTIDEIELKDKSDVKDQQP